MKIAENEYWIYYINEEKNNTLDREKTGKWMYFFDRKDKIKEICSKAIKSRVVVQCKHSNNVDGVSCFYVNCDNIDDHKNVIKFFLENNMIPKTKSGKFYNIGFKLDSQTRARKYGEDFVPTLKLSDFINLETGRFYNGKDI